MVAAPPEEVIDMRTDEVFLPGYRITGGPFRVARSIRLGGKESRRRNEGEPRKRSNSKAAVEVF